MTAVRVTVDDGRRPARHNDGVPPPHPLIARLRRLVPRRPPAVDQVLALIMMLAAVVWVLFDRHSGLDSGPLTAFPQHMLKPSDPSVAPYVPLSPGGTEVIKPAGAPDPYPRLLLNVLATAPLALRRRMPYTAFVIAF